MRDLIERQGGKVLDEIYLPMQPPPQELDRLVGHVLALRPDVVFSTLVGSNIGGFCERYADAGIDPADIPIAGHNVTAAELCAIYSAESARHSTRPTTFTSIRT